MSRPKSPVLKQIGRNIKRARANARLNQWELAEQAGISRASLSNIERGAHTPGIPLVDKLAQILGLTTAQLLGPEGSDCLEAARPKLPAITLANGQQEFSAALQKLITLTFELSGRVNLDAGLPFDREAAAAAVQQILAGIGALQQVTGEKIEL